MDKHSLLAYLKTKPELVPLAIQAGGNRELLESFFSIVQTEHSPVRYSCTKAIRILSEQQPRIVYSYFDEIASWLHDANSFVKWKEICQGCFLQKPLR